MDTKKSLPGCPADRVAIFLGFPNALFYIEKV